MGAEQGVARRAHLRLLTWPDDGNPPRRMVSGHGAPGHPTGARRSVSVLIAAGQNLVRASYRALLERDEGIQIVGEAGSAQHALALARQTSPDVALLDLALPGLDDPGAIAEVVSHAAFARVAVMMIAARESDDRVLGAVRAGAAGVLSNDAEPAELIRAAQVLAGGDAVLPAGLVRRLAAELPGRSEQHGDHGDQLDELTDREREVVALVAAGLSNGEIGARLAISPATAKTHVSRAMVKLGARDRAQVVVMAYEAGLVQTRREAVRRPARAAARLGAIA